MRSVSGFRLYDAHPEDEETSDQRIAFAGAHIARRERPHKLFERTAAVFLLLVVHGLLLVLFNPKITIGTAPPVREITISLQRSLQAKAPPAPIEPAFETPKSPPVAPGVARVYPAPPVTSPMPSRSGLSGLGESLFNCGLGNSGNVTPEERAHCRHLAAPPPGAAEIGMPKTSRALQAARWAAALATRREPPRIPCVGLGQIIEGAGPGAQKAVVVPMVDPLCVLNQFLNSPAK
ncbi:MAG TPA: hypothetical protein VNX86_13080 [Rhizomicrobium sp.]|jgi:hypothetical protein|nr:hypothetical protein [Rhizomicrobium sp.]